MGKEANKDVFKQIFKDHWAEFKQKYPKYRTEYYDEVINKMLGCCNCANGFISYICLECGEEKKIPFSCKSSFCLTCAKIYTDEWVEYIGKTLFKGMRYRHLVLTIPERLKIWFYRNPELLDALMKEGHNFSYIGRSFEMRLWICKTVGGTRRQFVQVQSIISS